MLQSNSFYIQIATSTDTWKTQTIPLTIQGKFRVLFEGVRGDSFEGDVAIDDIHFEKCGSGKIVYIYLHRFFIYILKFSVHSYVIEHHCLEPYFSQKQLPRKMTSHLVIIECAGYIFWLLFKRRINSRIIVLLSSVAPYCSAEEFTCNKPECVPLSYQCNFYDDCQDRSDEVTVHAFTKVSFLNNFIMLLHYPLH